MESAAENYLDSVQLRMLDKMGELLAAGNADDAFAYAREVIYPFVEAFPEVLDSEGNKIQPKIGDAVTRLLSDAYTVKHDYWSEVLGKTEPELVDGWEELFESVRKEVSSSAEAEVVLLPL